MNVALPDVARPGLHQKPLDAAIGQLLAPYSPGSHQGDSKQNEDANYVHFADHFEVIAVRRYYCVHHQMDEVCGFHKSH